MRSPTNSSQMRQRVESFILVPANLTGSLAQDTDGVTEGTYRCTASWASSVGTINFNEPFARVPTVIATPLHATTELFATITAVSATQVSIKITTEAGAQADPTTLHVVVVGYDSADQVG